MYGSAAAPGQPCLWGCLVESGGLAGAGADRLCLDAQVVQARGLLQVGSKGGGGLVDSDSVRFLHNAAAWKAQPDAHDVPALLKRLRKGTPEERKLAGFVTELPSIGNHSFDRAFLEVSRRSGRWAMEGHGYSLGSRAPHTACRASAGRCRGRASRTGPTAAQAR